MTDSMGRIEIDRTIHARDWTEGYNKGREEGIDEAIGQAKSACYDSSMGLDNMCWMERRLDREAKRLKEKGK